MSLQHYPRKIIADYSKTGLDYTHVNSPSHYLQSQ